MDVKLLKGATYCVLQDVFWSIWLVTALILLATFPVFGLYNMDYTVYMVWLTVKWYVRFGGLMLGIFIWVNPFNFTLRGTN